MVSITNDRGDEISRHVVGVGAIPAGEQRKFTVSVDVFKPAEAIIPEKPAAPPQHRLTPSRAR